MLTTDVIVQMIIDKKTANVLVAFQQTFMRKKSCLVS